MIPCPASWAIGAPHRLMRCRSQAGVLGNTGESMRGTLARLRSSDRISSFAVLTAGLLCGASVFFVALPLAQSSPFPTPKDGGWISDSPSYRLASAAMIPVTLGGTASAEGNDLRESLGVQAAVEWEDLTTPPGAVDRTDYRNRTGAAARRRS